MRQTSGSFTVSYRWIPRQSGTDAHTVRYSKFCRGAEFFTATNRRNRLPHLGEREAAVIELGLKGVVLEAHNCIVALCPDRHFPRRAGLYVLGCIPLDSYPLRAQECWAFALNA
jgi:hypothetical protein